MDASSSFPGDGGALSQSEGLPEGPQSSAELDSFSDSFTNITPSSAEPAASVLSTETLGRVDLTQEDERPSHEGVHHLNAEALQEEGLEPDQCPAPAGVENQAGKNQRAEVGAQSVCWWILLVGKCAVSGPGGVSRIKLVSEAVRPLSTVILVSNHFFTHSLVTAPFYGPIAVSA